MGPIHTMARSRLYPQRRELVGGRWAGWYNRQYPDLGRVDMSYELLWAGDGDGDGGWRVPVSPQPCPGHGVYLCIDHVFV